MDPVIIEAAEKLIDGVAYQTRGKRPFVRALSMMKFGMQTVHTPFALCHDIISKLAESVDIKEQQIAVLFNLEFAVVLIEDFGVRPSRITFIADDDAEESAARHWYNIKKVLRVSYDGTKKNGERISIMPKIKKQFDVVIMNPPYQAPIDLKKEGGKKTGTRGGSLWDKFVSLSLDLAKNGGHVVNVHPPAWRKPEHALWAELSQFDMRHLALHDKPTGIKVFGASTPFDWYVLHKAPAKGKTVLVNQKGEQTIVDLREQMMIPNWNTETVANITTATGGCEVLYSRSDCGTDKLWMNEEKNRKFKYPCVHSMTKANGLGFWYCSRKPKHEPKVILSFGENQYPYNDYKGEYGMTQISFGIPVSSKREGDMIVKAINSEKFREVIRCTKWGAFQTEWRMFKYFRKDFWKDFV